MKSIKNKNASAGILSRVSEKMPFALMLVVIVISFSVQFCKSDPGQKKKENSFHITEEYLLEKGFRKFKTDEGAYTTEKIKCSEIKRQLGFDWDDLEYRPSMWVEQWAVEVGDREFHINLWQEKNNNVGKDYLRKHPEAICSTTVRLKKTPKLSQKSQL